MSKADTVASEYAKENGILGLDYEQIYDAVKYGYDQAKKDMEIEKEELIDKFCEWVKKNATYIHPRKGTEECVINLGKLKEAMRNE